MRKYFYFLFIIGFFFTSSKSFSLIGFSVEGLCNETTSLGNTNLKLKNLESTPSQQTLANFNELIKNQQLSSQDSIAVLRKHNHRVDSLLTKLNLNFAKQLTVSIGDFVLPIKNSTEKARYFHLSGKVNHELGNFNLSEYYYNQSIQIYNELELPNSVSIVKLDLIDNYIYNKNYDKGLIEAIPLLDYFEKKKDNNNVALTKRLLGHLYEEINEEEKGLEYMLQNLEYFKKTRDSVEIGKTLNNIGLVYSYHMKLDTARHYLNESLKIHTIKKDSLGMAENYSNLSNCYYKAKNYEKSLNLATKAMDLFLNKNELKYVHFVLRNIGNIKFKQGLLDEAEHFFEKYYQKRKVSNRLEAGMMYYSDISKIEKEKQNFDKALEYYKISRRYKDSIHKEEERKIVSELGIKYDTERKEKLIQIGKKRINALEYEKLRVRTRNAIGVSSILLLASIIVFSLNKRRIKQKRDLILLRKEEEFTRVKLEFAKKTIESNNIKLNNFTNNIIEKTRLIESLERKITEFYDLNVEQDSIQLEKYEELLKLKILTEEDWIKFKSLFKEVYKDFLSTLTTQYSNLTEGEKRYLILLKLGINPKEMASILGISASGIYACRYRLKKKLKFEDDKDFNAIIEGLN